MCQDVQSFLGFGNFYRRFIQGFAHITAPLTTLTRKDTTWHWDNDQQMAFDNLKQRFTSAPILLMPDFSKPFRLETDASDYDYGAILSQQSNDGPWLPVAYMSKQMLPAERNYVIYDKELLAIIEALKLWRHYLEGSPHPSIFGPITKILNTFVRRSPLIAAKPAGAYSSPVFGSLFPIVPERSIKPII